MTEKAVGLSALPIGNCSFLTLRVSTYRPWALEKKREGLVYLVSFWNVAAVHLTFLHSLALYFRLIG